MKPSVSSIQQCSFTFFPLVSNYFVQREKEYDSETYAKFNELQVMNFPMNDEFKRGGNHN